MIMNQLMIYRIDIERKKMNRFNAFKVTIFQQLINRITFHAMWKTYKQWKFYKIAISYESLESCIKIYRKIMNLSCAHKIKKTTKYSDDVDQLHIDYVHSHWRLKKSFIEKIEVHRQFEHNEFRDDDHVFVEIIEKKSDELRILENDDNEWIKYEHFEFKRIIQESFDNIIERFENAIFETSFEANLIVENMKKNNHIDFSIEESTFEAFFEVNHIVENMKKNNHIEFSIEKHDFVENELADDDFLDVNDFEQMKTKERFRKTKKKKSFMTKIQNKIVKFIRRNFSRFEHVKQRFQITCHQQNDVTQRSELEQERQNQRKQRKQRNKKRENKERENKERKKDQREKRQELHAFEKKKTQH